ncbi:MAG: restriction endonuclease subunit S [Chitinophagales bacterium]
MKKYPKYKNSGIEWLGEIPVHWEVRRLKKCSIIKTGKTPRIANANTDYFKNGLINWFTPSDFYSQNGELLNSKRKITENAIKNKQVQLFKENSIYLIGVGATIGKIGYSILKASANQQINNIEFSKNIFYKFGYYALLVSRVQIQFLADFTTLPILNQTKTKEVLITIPSISEQKAIAKFLDYKLEKINRFIAKKKQLIELLKEQKAAIINRAVTKGLDPKVKMKDSGIEWLGEIPEHWIIAKMKNICSVRQGLQIVASERHHQNNGSYYEYITIKGINNPTNPKEYIANPSQRVICNKKNILMARTGATGQVITNVEGVFHNNFFLVDYDTRKIYKEYLYYYLKSIKIKKYLLLVAGTTTIPDLNHGEFYNAPFFIFSISEQKNIVAYIETETQKIDTTISTIEKEIGLVAEYKTALIAEAVTGKIDVRRVVFY